MTSQVTYKTNGTHKRQFDSKCKLHKRPAATLRRALDLAFIHDLIPEKVLAEALRRERAANPETRGRKPVKRQKTSDKLLKLHKKSATPRKNAKVLKFRKKAA